MLISDISDFLFCGGSPMDSKTTAPLSITPPLYLTKCPDICTDDRKTECDPETMDFNQDFMDPYRESEW
jgi:hypothetical protein